MASPPIDIQWEAPGECPDARSLRASIERLLGRRLETLPDPHVRASGRVHKNDAGNWEVQVQLAVGERVESDNLVAKRCSALADAMALKVALAIDPLAVVDSVWQQPSTPKAPSAAAQDTTRGAAKRESAASFGLRVASGLALGPLPGATPGAGVYASVQLQSFRAELGGQVYWGGVAHYRELPNLGADLQLFVGSLRGCATPGSGAWMFPVCGGLELGLMRGNGYGVQDTKQTSGVWGGLIAGPAVQLQLTRRLSVWLETDASVTILAPEFHMRNLDTLYTPPAGGARASAGFETVF